MKGIVTLIASLVLLVGITPEAEARGGYHKVERLRVMSRNLYLGSDLSPLVTEEDLEDGLAIVLSNVAENNFPFRAQALAREVKRNRPDLIGLQEVFDFSFDCGSEFEFKNGAPPFRNMLDDLLEALKAQGLKYKVVASVQNVDLLLPELEVPEGSPLDGLCEAGVQLSVRATDRDVILARRGLPGSTKPLPFSDFCPQASADGGPGCNYSVVAPAPPPLDNIKRGFVGVQQKIRGKAYWVINTHLEVQNPDGTPPSQLIQAAQAQELIASVNQLQAQLNPEAVVVAVGDFNSSPDDPILELGGGVTIVPPYMQMLAAGYGDAWDVNILKFLDPNGYTCCQDKDLANPTSELDERVDLVFVRGTRFKSLSNVTGAWPLDDSPNWASDHGGVMSRLLIFRGPRAR